MDYIQFRVHPSMGMARFGPSTDWYFLGPEVPRFVQERYPKLRFQPVPLRHPASSGSTPPQPDTGSYRDKFADPNPDPDHPERSRRIMPQAARFRVFAYVYATRDTDAWPYKIFELTPSDADVEWTVEVSNEKSVTPDGQSVVSNDPNAQKLSTKTSSAPTKCQKGTKPNLAWLKLEKDANDKPTGRLHVIGNEGEATGGPLKGKLDSHETFPDPYLYQNDWFDPAADGTVEATVELKPAFKSRFSGAKYLIPGQKDPADLPQNGKVAALPAWVVVNMPDYNPDMGHFVSLWDLALDLTWNLLTNGKPKPKPVDGQHHRVTDPNTYAFLDYWVHLHPLLGLFSDVTYASGQARAGGYEAKLYLNGIAVRGKLDARAAQNAPTIKLKIPDALHLKAASLGQPFLVLLSDHTPNPLGGTFEFALGSAIARDGSVTVTRGVSGMTPQGMQQSQQREWPAGTNYYAATKTGFIETPLGDSTSLDDLTTITVDVQSAHEMPDPARDGNFKVAISSGTKLEWLLCTVIDKPNGKLTVQRGIDGTDKRAWGMISDTFPVVIAPALGHKALNARAQGTNLATGGSKPIANALLRRLRLPGTVYDRTNFKKYPDDPAHPDQNSKPTGFPRQFGRRMRFDDVSTSANFAQGPVNVDPGGSLSRFHGIFTKQRGIGVACKGNPLTPDPDPDHPGQRKALPPKLPSEQYTEDLPTHVQWLDDYYWIVSEADMPMLKELALTHIQLTQFQAWAGGYTDTSWFERNLGVNELASFFNDTHTMEEYLDRLFNANGLSRYAPVFLDMASMGRMLGGSFLPGIEVGREGGKPKNWTMYHGGTPSFPDLRFHPQGTLDSRPPGTLTKDLSVPWFADYIDCGETFWPTSRPEVVSDKNAIAYPWLNKGRHANTEEKFKIYWLKLGFLRRQQHDTFAEDETLFHRP